VVIPEQVSTIVDGRAVPVEDARWFDKLRPVDGSLLCRTARSQASDVDAAVAGVLNVVQGLGADAGHPSSSRRTSISSASPARR
jgi:hypothetical protein